MIEKLPDGWRLEKMTNLSDILDGDRGKNYPKQEDFSDNDYCLFLTTKNVTKKGFNFDTTQFITKDKDILLNKGRLQRNDLVITTRGTVGNIAFFNQDVPYDIIRINSGMAIIRITTKNLSYSFVNTYFKSNIFHRYVSEIISGSAQPQITIAKLKNLTIPIPPLPQQAKIVKVLDISSALIEKQKELIKNYDLFLKSKFIEMFGDPIKNPFAWEVVKLGKYGTLARGKSAHRPRNAPFLYGGIYPFIQTGDITKGNSIYLKKYKQTYSEDGIKQSRLFLKDTIAITIAANIGDTKILGFDCYFPDSVVGFNVERPLFVSSLFCYYKPKLEQQATKTAQKNINLKVLNNLDVIHPPITLQNKFASIVEKTELIKEKENKKLESLQTLHDSLMQKAFKGEIG